MNDAWLDGLVAMFRDIFSAGITRLDPEVRALMKTAVGINLIFAAMAWAAAWLAIFGHILTTILKVVLYGSLYLSFAVLSQYFIEYCIWGGLTIGGVISGGDFTIEEFQKPSTVLMKGFMVTAPINQFITDHTGISQPWNYFTLQPLSWAAAGIWFVFALLSLYLVWVQILMYMVVAYVVIFLPFAPLGPLSFLAERGVGLVFSTAGRLGVTAVLTALAWPLVEHFLPSGEVSRLLTAKGNVDMAAVFWLAASVGFILIMVWSMSSIVSGFFAGGPMLSGWHLIPGASLASSMASSVRSGFSGGGGGGGGSTSTPREPVTSSNGHVPSVAQIQAGVPWRHR